MYTIPEKIRIAYLCPTLELGFYLQPVLRDLNRIIPEIEIFTSKWSGFVPGCEDAFKVNLIGKHKEIALSKPTTGYRRQIQLMSTKIVTALLRFKPQLIIATGFSLWTLLVVILKPLTGWRVIVVYSGSSPNVDFIDEPVRLFYRRFIAKNTNAFITNSQGGKAYLTKMLKTEESKVFAKP